MPLAVGNQWVFAHHQYWNTDQADNEVIYEPHPFSSATYDTLTAVRDSVVAKETWYLLDGSQELRVWQLETWLVNRSDGVYRIDEDGEASLLFPTATSANAPAYANALLTRTTDLPFTRDIVGIGSVEVRPTYDTWHHARLPSADTLTVIAPPARQEQHVHAKVGFAQIEQACVSRKQDSTERLTPIWLHRYTLVEFLPTE